MKNLISAIIICCFSFVNAQQRDSLQQHKLYVKANAAFLPVGMLNAGVEYQLDNKFTLQGDVFISPWKSFLGKYALGTMGIIEGRYYFTEVFKKWYVGAHIGAAAYKIQKWNYWNDNPVQYTPDSPVYVASDLYQQGFSLFIGGTVGYQFQIYENWNLDLFIGGGHTEGFYHGYHKKLGVRYEADPRQFNRSGEWAPYRGGLMISYRLK